MEYYKNYLYGSEFEIINDHKALFSALSPNQGNKTYHSRLTRWVDRLLPFTFTIKHLAGTDMGFTDLISRSHSGNAIPPSHYDEEFVVATTKKNITHSIRWITTIHYVIQLVQIGKFQLQEITQSRNNNIVEFQ